MPGLMDLYGAEEMPQLNMRVTPSYRQGQVITPERMTEEYLAMQQSHADKMDAINARKAEIEAQKIGQKGQNIREGIVGAVQGYQAGKQMRQAAEKAGSEQETQRLQQIMARKQIGAYDAAETSRLASEKAQRESVIAGTQQTQQAIKIAQDLENIQNTVLTSGPYAGNTLRVAKEKADLAKDVAGSSAIENQIAQTKQQIEIANKMLPGQLDKLAADTENTRQSTTTQVAQQKLFNHQLTLVKKEDLKNEVLAAFKAVGTQVQDPNKLPAAIAAKYQELVTKVETQNNEIRLYNASLTKGQPGEQELPISVVADAAYEYAKSAKESALQNAMTQALVMTSHPLAQNLMTKVSRINNYNNGIDQLKALQGSVKKTTFDASSQDAVNQVSSILTNLGMTEQAADMQKFFSFPFNSRQGVLDKAIKTLESMANSEFSTLINDPNANSIGIGNFITNFAMPNTGYGVDPLWGKNFEGGMK